MIAAIILVTTATLLGLGIALTIVSFERDVPDVCWHCEYDLSRTPTRLCPECGLQNALSEEKPFRLRHGVMFVLGMLLIGLGLLPLAVIVTLLLGTQL